MFFFSSTFSSVHVAYLKSRHLNPASKYQQLEGTAVFQFPSLKSDFNNINLVLLFTNKAAKEIIKKKHWHPTTHSLSLLDAEMEDVALNCVKAKTSLAKLGKKWTLTCCKHQNGLKGGVIKSVSFDNASTFASASEWVGLRGVHERVVCGGGGRVGAGAITRRRLVVWNVRQRGW